MTAFEIKHRNIHTPFPPKKTLLFGTVYMIPEWLSFPNKVHSRLKFTLHSHDKIEQFNLRHSGLCSFRIRSDTYAPLALALHNLRFSFWSKVHFQLKWYQNDILYQHKNFNQSENGNELILEWLVQEQNFVLVSCEQIQRNIWRWNELVLEWKSFQYHVNSSLDCLNQHRNCTCQGTWRDTKLNALNHWGRGSTLETSGIFHAP